MNKFLLSLCCMWLFISGDIMAQQHAVTGKVTSGEDGSTLPGVNVVVKGTQQGTITDMDGNYKIDVPENAVLKFSYIGYLDQEFEVGDKTVIDVTMQVDTKQLQEVVVTAFGVEKEKKSLGYSVSEVSGEDLSTVKQTNVVNSLAGRVPGLVVTQSTGGPGSGTRVIIRGNNSLTGNNQPLYVVDGVPIDNSGFGSAAGSGTGEYARSDYGTGISDINPDDIASISVLKGPNAAALYGSRAANGVVMITTKKGRANQGLGVSYSANFTFENPVLLPKYQNEYGQGSEGNTYTDLKDLKNHGGSWGAMMDGSDQLYWTGETRPYVAQPNNVKDFFRTGSSMINTVAIDGGTDKANMRFSYTNTKLNSILPNSDLIKHNFNLRSFAQMTDKFSIDSRVTYFHQETKNRATQGTEGIMAYLYDVPRNLVIDDLKNYQNPEDLSTNSWTEGGGNPYWILNHDINRDYRDRVQGFVKANYDFTPYLTAFIRAGTDQVAQKIETVSQPGHWFYKTGRFNYGTTKTGETNTDFLVMFNKGLSERFHLDVNVGGNYRLNTYEAQSVYGENFKIPTKPIVSGAVIATPSYTPTQKKKVTSLYGSAELSYNNLVYLDLSARNDWSSSLPKSNWSYFYPSASLSLLLNEFIDPDQTFMDYWKIRGSWARVGNDTDPYQLTNAFDLVNSSDSYLGLPVLTRPSVLYNEDLKPEQVTSSEIGTEARFFKNRLYLDLSYYNIVSNNLIMNVPVSQSTGYSQFHTNVGQMTNKGVEAMLGGTPFQSGSFTWDVSVNFAHNKNTLDNLIEGLDKFIFTTTNSGTVTVQATVGGGYGDIMGTTWRRDDNGNIEVDDNGRPLATADKVLLGNYQPDWTGGLSNTFSYKNFNLRVLIDARIGGQLYSGTDAGLDGSGVSVRTLPYRTEGITVDGVDDEGKPNDKKISGEQYWSSYSGIASNYVYDQTNIRLREASLTYSLPKTLLGNTPLRDVTIGLIGRNLFFLYKKMDDFDPESSFSTSNYAQGVLYYNLPTTRQYGFDVNIKF